MDEVKSYLQASVERYTSEMKADTYDGGAFVIEDVLEKLIIENEKHVPHDVWEWFHVWLAFGVLDGAEVRLHPYFDYGDEQFEAFSKLLEAIGDWK